MFINIFLFMLILKSCTLQSFDGTNMEEFDVTEPTQTSGIICSTCNCTGNVIDCAERDIKAPFKMEDWAGVINFNPTTVNLSGNHLGTLTRVSGALSIQHLNLSNSEIATIEEASFCALVNLVSLDLSRNKLVTSSITRRVFVGPMGPSLSIDGMVPFAKMRYLSLANNDIHSLPQDVFVFMNELTTLDLSGNPLAYMDQVTMAAITDLINLKELLLNGCELETLPEGLFRRQRRLRRLDLSNNRFATVPAVLAEAVNLEFLDFGRNPVEVINKTSPISKLSKLQELRLCRLSKLTTIATGALSGLANLVSLHICFNPRLTNLHEHFLMWMEEDDDQELWPRLEELYLNNNNLSSIRSGYVERWDQLIKMDFSNNPFSCDCSNQWTVDVLVPLLLKSGANDTVSHMICKKPDEMRGLSFLTLNEASRTLTCQESDEVTQAAVPDVAVWLGIMIGILATFPIVLIVILLWRRGYFEKCRKTKMESPTYDDETDAL